MFKFALGAFAAGATAAELREYTDYNFEVFLNEHGKVYSLGKEYEQRKQTFEQTLLKVTAPYGVAGGHA